MSQTAGSSKQQKYDADVARGAMKFEVALIPVSDVDRTKEFYTRLGWRLDDDLVVGDDFRVVQLTPPGSGCSISFGKGVTAAAPGSFRGGLIVSDIEAAHQQMVARGINASEVFHGSPFSPAGRISGPDPERQSYCSFVSFEDPDGNAWIVQEVTRRLPGRIDPATTAFASANDLASAIRRAAAAHGELEKRIGQRDANWPDWYAAYMAAEQVGTEPPKSITSHSSNRKEI
jgi:catechol 2,3-dioxygenase-like lactoylglutathione lyase family enzyme